MAGRCSASLGAAGVIAALVLLLLLAWPFAPQPPWQIAAAAAAVSGLEPANDAAAPPLPRILLAAGTLDRCGDGGSQPPATATLSVACSFGLDSGWLFVSSTGLAASSHVQQLPLELALAGVDALTCLTVRVVQQQQQSAPLFMFLLHRSTAGA